MALFHTLGYGRSVCLKNCGGVSTDLAVALTLAGFDARVVSHPGHFTCGVNIEGIGVDIDLSHLQFDPETVAIHAESESPEADIHDRFLSRLWENPYLIGKIELRSPFRSEPLEVDPRSAADMRNQLERLTKAVGRRPDFGSKADARPFLSPLL